MSNHIKIELIFVQTFFVFKKNMKLAQWVLLVMISLIDNFVETKKMTDRSYSQNLFKLDNKVNNLQNSTANLNKNIRTLKSKYSKKQARILNKAPQQAVLIKQMSKPYNKKLQKQLKLDRNIFLGKGIPDKNVLKRQIQNEKEKLAKDQIYMNLRKKWNKKEKGLLKKIGITNKSNKELQRKAKEVVKIEDQGTIRKKQMEQDKVWLNLHRKDADKNKESLVKKSKPGSLKVLGVQP